MPVTITNGFHKTRRRRFSVVGLALAGVGFIAAHAALVALVWL